jgi:TonB family protein
VAGAGLVGYIRFLTRAVLFTAIASVASAQSAHELARQARAAAFEQADSEKAESVINSALKQWERDQEPHDVEYARALDLAGMLSHLRQADLETVVEPLYREALEIFDHAGAGVPEGDNALALELEALALKELGRTLEATPLRERASKIRIEIVRNLNRSAATSTPYKMGPGVKPPPIISRREPSYTEIARMVKVQGTVVLGLVVDTDGKPGDFRLLRSVGFGLDEQAVHDVGEWRFLPAIKDGNPVAVEVSIEVNFRLL